MKLSYTESIPTWLHTRANEMITRPIDLTNKYIHVTQLLQPAPQLQMMNANWQQLEQSADDLIPAMMGTAWHKYLEGSIAGGYSERRMEVQHNSEAGPYTIIGTPDWFDSERLIDFKTAKVWSKIFGKREWEEQLNVYRWLIYQALGLKLEQLEIHVVYMDWTKNGMMRNDKHPRKRWEVLPVPAWDFEDIRRFVDAKLLTLEATAPFDVCSPEERWERGEHWALMKHGRKSAIKKHDTEQAALDACFDAEGKQINAYYVEHRPGVPVRCLDWCSVKRFCSFGKKLDAPDEQ